ncbi:hypothetical protein GH714_007037 [Hevea brasiliensis]|uniref:ADP/ATP translocase n=1 Tax=Hevea brasiliensis TaxID=3981 RepID=A0A6A6K4U1_HEVBR|nr:hypothetical protein GH714_007037 [Hevea brasiliensis]
MVQGCCATTDLCIAPSTASSVCVQAPSEKGFASFAIDFLMSGVFAAVSKTVAAPIECVKLLIQNQDEIIKSGRLSEPYKGIGDYFKPTMKDEGLFHYEEETQPMSSATSLLRKYDFLKPVVLTGKLQDSFFASFALGWLITNGACLASYPIDPVRIRMMMTSGKAVKYKSSLDAFSQILKNEGAKSLFKGAGANIL